jgi:hypothetical protein
MQLHPQGLQVTAQQVNKRHEGRMLVLTVAHPSFLVHNIRSSTQGRTGELQLTPALYESTVGPRLCSKQQMILPYSMQTMSSSMLSGRIQPWQHQQHHILAVMLQKEQHLVECCTHSQLQVKGNLAAPSTMSVAAVGISSHILRRKQLLPA